MHGKVSKYGFLLKTLFLFHRILNESWNYVVLPWKQVEENEKKRWNAVQMYINKKLLWNQQMRMERRQKNLRKKRIWNCVKPQLQLSKNENGKLVYGRCFSQCFEFKHIFLKIIFFWAVKRYPL